MLELGGDVPDKTTKTQLWKEYSIPSLEVVPIPSELSLADFVKRYKRLSSITLRVLQTNSELDNSELLKSVRKTGSKLGAKNSQITHSAAEKEGLDQGEAVAQLKAVALDGNVDVKLSGVDAAGNKLVGNNDEFKLKVLVENVSSQVGLAAAQLNAVLQEEVKGNNIKLGKDANLARTLEIIKRIARIKHV
jgi:hypothetical protein